MEEGQRLVHLWMPTFPGTDTIMAVVNDTFQKITKPVASNAVKATKSKKLIIRVEQDDDAAPNPIVELSTSVIVSTLLHVVILIIFATWYYSTSSDRDEFVLDSSLRGPEDKVDLDLRSDDAVILTNTELKKTTREVVKLASKNALSNFNPHKMLGGGAKGISNNRGMFGSGDEASSYVFIVDSSTSMRNGQRFYLAIKELKRTVSVLSSGQKFFIFFYNTRTFPMTPFELRSQKRLVSATPEEKQKAIQFIDTQRPRGETFPADALQKALAMKPEMIYFLTDGEIPPDIPEVIKKANKSRTIVNTVALGYQNAEKIMKRIARENNGRYRFVKDPSFNRP